MRDLQPGILDALRAGLTAALPFGCSITSIEPEDVPTSSVQFRLKLRRAPTGAVPIRITGTGWGRAYEETSLSMLTAIDPAVDRWDALEGAITLLEGDLARQTLGAIHAHGCGIELPLRGDGLMRTDHLIVDPDAVTTLAGLLGSTEAVGTWMRQQLEMRRAYIEQGGTTEKQLFDVNGHIVQIQFRLNPLAIGFGDTSEGDMTSQWTDNQVYVAGTLPETILLHAEGRRIGEIVSGTPVDHRIIEAVVVENGEPTVDLPPFIAFAMETPRVPLQSLMPRL